MPRGPRIRSGFAAISATSIGAGAVFGAAFTAGIAPAAPPASITAPDPTDLDFFATAIAATSDRIVTGYPSRHPALRGMLFTFTKQDADWTQEAALSTGTDGFGDGLALALAMQGDTIVAGLPLWRSPKTPALARHGRVIVLRRERDGSLTTIASLPGISHRAALGTSVALDEPWIVCGSPGVQVAATPPAFYGAGAVQIARREGASVTPVASLSLAPLQSVVGFGQQVAIAGEWAAASGNLYSTENGNSGVVALMHLDPKGAWSITSTITAPIPSPGDRFGLALSMRNDLLLVGAPAPGQLQPEARGAAHLYRLVDGAWTLERTFEAPSDRFCAGFGRSVAIGEGTIAIGADETNETESGDAAVFLFREQPGVQGAAWVPSGRRSGHASEDFGSSIAFAGKRLAVGVPGAAVTNEGEAQGRVLLFDLLAADLNGDGLVDGDDLGTLLGAWGACPGCPEDLDGDDLVDGSDLGILLGQWSQP